RAGRAVHLVMAGWAANQPTADAFRAGAAAFAPPARVSFVDGQDPQVRAAVWPASDIVISLPDNIQETFGLVVVEGMAAGRPVVGSDWDGYKDLIADGQTGYLVPTRAVRGATAGATARLVGGAVNYDYFLAGCCQAVAVDPGAAADALARLVGDDALRERMGAAGRERVLARFAWGHVIRAYESLWAEQEREVGRVAAAGVVRYPPPEVSFAGYPTGWLDDASPVQAVPGAAAVLPRVLGLALTGFVAERRCADPVVLAELLRAAEAGATVGALAADLEGRGLAPEPARATVAWLLKYGLLTPG
ncbi:MAG: glycosyltransferase family 4 protein, partial [Gemmataceae bacterium]|nr:glycosyltransferase family 4 protein [Gemmataceae bacterium]